MREILFKLKRIDNGEWIYCNVCGEIVGESGNRTRLVIKEDETTSYYDYVLQIKHLIAKDTLCQYTGMTDKNGNKIWENDILDCQDRLAQVKWHGELGTWDSWFLRYKGKLCSNGIEVVEWKDRAEVIGNIFDNLELIKE